MSYYEDLRKRSYQKSPPVDSSTLSQPPSTPATKRQRLKPFTTRLHQRLSSTIYHTPKAEGSTQSLPVQFEDVFCDLYEDFEDTTSVGSHKSISSLTGMCKYQYSIYTDILIYYR